jgi:hypothetical protein
VHPSAEALQLRAEGKIEALIGFPPVPQELRAKNVGRVVVNSALDRPWSQYFCCVVGANRAFVRQHPVATTRALRAILKATDVCAVGPERAAQRLVSRGFTPNFDDGLQTLREIPYGRWREYEVEDAVRCSALRLQEAGMVKSTPQQIIARGTDGRFLHELKRELKGSRRTPRHGRPTAAQASRRRRPGLPRVGGDEIVASRACQTGDFRNGRGETGLYEVISYLPSCRSAKYSSSEITTQC